MKKRHTIKKRFIWLFVLCSICLPAISFATEGSYKNFSETNSSSDQSEQSFDVLSHDGRMKKLRHDLEEFESNGPDGIAPTNMFYPTCETNLSADEIDSALEGTNLYGTGQSFNEVEDHNGISSLFFAAMANHESFYGYSNIAENKRNIFGFNAQDDDPYNKANEYSTLSECIEDVGHKVRKLYLNTDGRYFEGYSAQAMSINYSTDPDWDIKVNAHMTRIARKILAYYGY